MPTIGWFEILIIVAIAIIVLGPKDFPIMLKKSRLLDWYNQKIHK
jgi:sec-independent protein translocase protein TatB